MNTENTPQEQQPQPLYSASHYEHLYGAPSPGLMLLDPRRLFRRWRTLALVLALALVASIGYLWSAQKIYRASSLVELSVRRPRIMTQQPAVIEDQSSAMQSTEVFNTQLEKFKARTMLLAALKRLDAAAPGAFFPAPRGTASSTPANREEIERQVDRRVNRFEHDLTLTLVRRSRLIRVEFEHPDPQVAAAACNAFAQAAEASAYDENRTISDAAVVWLEAQADLQRKELLATEDALLAFRQQHKIDALESQRKTVDDALQEFNRALVEVESRQARQLALQEKLTHLKLDPERAGDLPGEIPRAEEIRAALEQWRVAAVERDSLLATYTPKHPEILARDNVVALYREQAMQALERAKATAHSDYKLLTEQAAALREKKDEQIQMAANLEMQIVERKTRLAALERTRDAADQSYRGILSRIQDARMAADENTATVKIVERASVPIHPVRPEPLRTLALALLLGLVGGLGLVIVSDMLEDRVTGPEDFEGRGIPILAVVPHVKASDRSVIATATLHKQFSEVVEAFAGLGTLLDSPRHKQQSRVILIASSIPSEGKTVTSCNLAAILAKKGRRVLLVDFDLRRPRLAGIFPIPPGHLLVLNALSDATSDLAHLPYPVADCPNLEVIASRPASETNPALSLGTVAGTLIPWARGGYDHVVLDAPPLGLVSDTLALAPLADFTLVMVRPEISRKRLTWHTLHRLRESGIHNAALVVNDLDLARMMYGAYSPYYHYQRHYKAYAPATESSEPPRETEPS